MTAQWSWQSIEVPIGADIGTRLDEMKRVHIHLVIIITKLSPRKFSFNF